MSANRVLFGAFALWATLCVVLLACAGTGKARVSQPPTGAQFQALVTSGPGQPLAPSPDLPATETAAPDHATDTDSASAPASASSGRGAWVAKVPLWPSDALRWHRLEPSLRLNPGHAPPRA